MRVHQSPSRSILACVLGLVVLLGGCEAVQDALGGMQKPSLDVSDVSLQNIGLDSVELVFDVDVGNPYAVPLPYAGLDFGLSSGGNRFLKGKTDAQGTIPVGETVTIPLTASVPFQQTLQVLAGVKPGSVVPYAADLGITLDIPGVGPQRLPVRTEGDLPIPTIPTIALKEVNWSKLGLSEAAAVLKLDVTNLNSFPFGLDSLSYALNLAGMNVGTSSLSNAVSFDAGGTQTVEIPISLRPMDLGLAAMNLLSGSAGTYDIRGTMNTMTPYGALNFPFQSAGNAPFTR